MNIDLGNGTIQNGNDFFPRSGVHLSRIEDSEIVRSFNGRKTIIQNLPLE
jgi:hypothetical protein